MNYCKNATYCLVTVFMCWAQFLRKVLLLIIRNKNYCGLYFGHVCKFQFFLRSNFLGPLLTDLRSGVRLWFVNDTKNLKI